MVLSVSGTTKMSPSRKRLGMSDSRLHTHSRAETVCPVTPSPVSSTWPTTWTFIMLVVPEMPRGTPAVMTTKSPLSTRPVFSAASTARSKRVSVSPTSSTKAGTTPQERFSWRHTCSWVVQPTMGYRGRNLESCRAVTPDLVTVMMALAPRSWAVVQVAWEMALVTSKATSLLSRELKRLM